MIVLIGLEAIVILALLLALLVGQPASQTDMQMRVLPTATAQAWALATVQAQRIPTRPVR